jgi:site-specific DNA recombinase
VKTIGIAGKVAVYLRQSLDREDNQKAINRQRRACLDLCRRKGWDTASIIEYCDNDKSASKGTREDYQQMLADIENGSIGAVVTYHIDRLTRQPMELEQFMLLTDRHGVQLATVSGDIDLGTDDGQCMARVLGAFARKEVQRKSARQKVANKQRAENGKAWNVRVFGYNGNKLVKREADAIAKACKDLLDGVSLYGIAQDWNRRGITTVKGVLWNGTSVRQVLARPRNAGLVVYDVHAAERAAKGKSFGEKVRGAIVADAKPSWPAIIDRETFDAVLTHLSDPSRHTGKKRARAYLLSGLAYCGRCGKKMGTTSRPTKAGSKRVVYQCKNVGCMRVVRDLIKTDQVVIDIITRRLARPDAAQIFATKTVDTKAITDRINKYRRLIRVAESEYDNGDITGVDLKRRRENLQPKIDALQTQLVGANTSRRLDGLIGNPKAREVFDALPLDRQRAVIDTVAVVTIKPATKPGGVFDPKSVTVEPKQT